jgi:hypothetical protein
MSDGVKNPNYNPNHGTPKVIDSAVFQKLTDVILESNGVPRKHLNEYPYNEFESRKILEKAEASVIKIARILELRIQR